MSKKSITSFLDNSSERTKRNYASTIRKYEEFHGTTIEKLVYEALDEQTNQVPQHLLKIIDRLEDFQNHLIDEDYIHNTISSMMGRIKTIYKRNRVNIPYITPINPKRTRRRDFIEFKDILTKEELRCCLKYMRPPAQARFMTMIQGGLSSAECNLLKTRTFIDDLRKYHRCDDDMDALRWLADVNHPVIWVVRLVREKTKKPYYALIGAEAVNYIASAKIYETEIKKYGGQIPPKLLTMHEVSFSELCRKVNKRCCLGLVAEQSKLRQHNLRRFHATYIKGSALTYEEQSLTNYEIDEMQGRGKTAVQDTYIKSNPIQQKLLYAKVMNNVSLFNEYDYQIVGDDVLVYLINPHLEKKKLEDKVNHLENQLQKKRVASEKVNALKEEIGEDAFNELVLGIINAK